MSFGGSGKSAKQRSVKHPRPYPQHYIRSTNITSDSRSFPVLDIDVEESNHRPPRRFFSKPPAIRKPPPAPFIKPGSLNWTLPLLSTNSSSSQGNVQSFYSSSLLDDSGESRFPSSERSTTGASFSSNLERSQSASVKRVRLSLPASTKPYPSSFPINASHNSRFTRMEESARPTTLKSAMKKSDRSSSTMSSLSNVPTSFAPRTEEESWVPTPSHSFVRRKAAIKADI
ncbi:hypothetical protein FRC17_005799, partial [Serendipita sp. 399]